MLSLQTLTMIEALLMSRNDSRWGEFMILAQTIGEVQQAKQALIQSRVQPAPVQNAGAPPPPAQPAPSNVPQPAAPTE